MANRIQCSNNLKQLGIATHTCHDNYHVLPPAGASAGAWNSVGAKAGPWQGKTCTTFFCLLPFLEQGNLYTAVVNQGGNVWTATVNGQLAYGTKISYLVCPSDPSNISAGYGNPNGPDGTWAISCYGANYLVFGDPPNGNQEGQARLPGSIPDGLANTILFGERYAQYGTGNGAPTGLNSSLWADSGDPWRPHICSPLPTKGYVPCPSFQVQPFPFSSAAGRTTAETSHPGGMNVCLADGSVHAVSGSISASVWASTCDPRDGVPLGPDW